MKIDPTQPQSDPKSDPDLSPLRIGNREIGGAEVELARELYFEFGPGRAFEVVRRMIAAGWKEFRLWNLTGRERSGIVGLVAHFGWDEEWQRRHRPVEPVVDAIAEEEELISEPADETAGDDEPGIFEKAIRDSSRAAAAATKAEAKFNKRDTGFQRWLKVTKPEWCWDWRFQRLIFRVLDRVVKRRLRRVMIFLPPRHGKSELVTVRFAAWMLLRDPKTRVVVGSYNQKLADRFSRHIRTIYLTLSEMEMDMEKNDLVVNRTDEWETRAGGGVKAVGVGSGITGFGADLIIIDDPVRSRSDAESANNRERIWEWFTDDLMTRLEPAGAVILIQTRWHEDDLAGRLLARVQSPTSKDPVQSPRSKVQGMEDSGQQRKEKWEVISLPALAEDGDPLGRRLGEALCPRRFSAAELLAKKEEMGSYSFAALYQQRPVPDAGGLFKREWFSRLVDRAPEGLRWFRGYDLAVSVKQTADYTASARVAMDKDGTLYIADVFRKRIEYPDQRRYVLERIANDADTEHGIELAVHGHAFVQDLLREAGIAAAAFRGVRVAGDKFTRALAWANRAEAGKIALVRGPWIDDFIEEACRFPQGKHDDQIDAVSLAVQMMTARKRRGWGF